jgi:hypothetical protein
VAVEQTSAERDKMTQQTGVHRDAGNGNAHGRGVEKRTTDSCAQPEGFAVAVEVDHRRDYQSCSIRRPHRHMHGIGKTLEGFSTHDTCNVGRAHLGF